MAEQFIFCPRCHHKIKLTEAFTHPIEERLRKELTKEQERILQDKEKEYDEKLSQDRARIEKQARKMAEDSVSTELKDLKSQVVEQ